MWTVSFRAFVMVVLILSMLQCHKKPIDVEPGVVEAPPAEQPAPPETGVESTPQPSPQPVQPSPLPPRRSVSPGDSAALKLVESGVTELDRGNLEDAERLFVQALRISPTNGRPHYYLGVLAFRQKDYQRALAFLTEAEVHLHGDNFWMSQILLQEGLILKQLKQIEASREKLLEALRRDPKNSWARSELEAMTGHE